MANCWGTNSFCGNPNPDRYIKLWDNKVVAVEGAKIVSQIDLSCMKIPYTNYQNNSYTIKAGAVNQVIDWGGLGANATMIFVSPRYEKEAIEKSTNNYLIWSFIDESDSYPIKELLWLTADKALPLKKIKVSNPSSYAIRIDVMVIGLDTSSSDTGASTVVSNFAFNNLPYASIRTWSSDQIYVGSGSLYETPELYININRIGNFERSGRFITIDDDSIGEIFLGMATEADAIQLYSSLNYLLNNKPTHGTSYTLPLSIDTTPPVLTYTPAVTFTPPSTYETNMFISGYGTEITKQNILDHSVLSIIDMRDGPISPNPVEVSITDGVNDVSVITSIGNYVVTIISRDLANNTQTSTLLLNVFV
jgi:hypothetical protein